MSADLVRIIDEYRDRRGNPSEASVARAIGISPQAISSWRKRGVRQLPDKETLRRLAEFVGVSYETVVLAAAHDAGYLDDDGGDGEDGSNGIANAV